MTIQAISWVLDWSEADGVDRLVLISMANHADERDESWPSVRMIAAEAHVSTNTVVKALRRLCELGELERVGMGSRTQSARYRFVARPYCDRGVKSVASVSRIRDTEAVVEPEPEVVDNNEGVADTRQEVSRIRDTGVAPRRDSGCRDGVAMVSRLARQNQEPKYKTTHAGARGPVDDHGTFAERDREAVTQATRSRIASETAADLPQLTLDLTPTTINDIRSTLRKATA